MSGELPIDVAPWWTARPALLRFVADLVAGELAALRHDPFIDPDGWDDSLSLEHHLGLDSLELLHVAGALSSALQMQHSGIEDSLLFRRSLGDWVDIADLALRDHDGELAFASSGSTGEPKRHVHGIDRLEQEARALAVLFPGRRRVLAAVPGHHIYGFLFTHLLPRHLGLGAAHAVDVRARVPATLAQHAAPGDLVIGHPSFWQAALAGGLDFPQDVVGVTSTAPCPDEIAAAAERCRLVRLVQVYGSSETAGIGWRASHRDDYSLLPYFKRAGVNEGALVRTLPDGRYATVQPPDLLSWSGPRTFAIRARHDGVVQVGGVNVHPEHVRAILLDHPGVADCAVRLMRPDEGERLKAFIIRNAADTSTDPDFVRGLRAWIDSRLPAPERPKAFTIGTQLPRTSMGKPADWLIG